MGHRASPGRSRKGARNGSWWSFAAASVFLSACPSPVPSSLAAPHRRAALRPVVPLARRLLVRRATVRRIQCALRHSSRATPLLSSPSPSLSADRLSAAAGGLRCRPTHSDHTAVHCDEDASADFGVHSPHRGTGTAVDEPQRKRRRTLGAHRCCSDADGREPSERSDQISRLRQRNGVDQCSRMKLDGHGGVAASSERIRQTTRHCRANRSDQVDAQWQTSGCCCSRWFSH